MFQTLPSKLHLTAVKVASIQFPFKTKFTELLRVLYYLNYGFDKAFLNQTRSSSTLAAPAAPASVQWPLLKMEAYRKNTPVVPIAGLNATNNPG